MGKLDDLRALGQPEISRQYVKSGGKVATPAEIAGWKARETGELHGLKRTIAEQAVEIAKLKAELASRDVTVSARRQPATAKVKSDAERARMYRERKRAAGK